MNLLNDIISDFKNMLRIRLIEEAIAYKYAECIINSICGLDRTFFKFGAS